MVFTCLALSVFSTIDDYEKDAADLLFKLEIIVVIWFTIEFASRWVLLSSFYFSRDMESLIITEPYISSERNSYVSVIISYFSINVEDNGIGIIAIKNDVDFKLQSQFNVFFWWTFNPLKWMCGIMMMMVKYFDCGKQKWLIAISVAFFVYIEFENYYILWTVRRFETFESMAIAS